MFVGHYGVSFAAKRLDRSIPLWVLFLAVQLLDVFWSLFVLLGIEKVRIVPGITASSPLDLYYMPYTHSLVAALLWSAGAALAYVALAKPRAARMAALAVALAVFSHWALDFVVHRPDLPLYDDAAKVGLGLWNFRLVAFALEAALFFGGMWLYFRADSVPRRPMVVFGLGALALHALVFFGPPPVSDKAAAVTALAAYAILAGIVARLERPHRPVASGSRRAAAST